MAYPVPRQSASARAQTRSAAPQNPGLIFDRFVPHNPDGDAKRAFLLEVVEASGKADLKLLSAFQQRWHESVQLHKAITFDRKTAWRFLTGIGKFSPLEVGFLFHRYGFPYLPGSSCKGIARARGLESLIEEAGNKDINELNQALELDDESVFWDTIKLKFPDLYKKKRGYLSGFRKIFGTTDSSGQAIFFDAVPKGGFSLEIDVMTPHFSQYYGGTSLPKDSLDPVPITFLTVGSETRFQFAVGWRGEPNQTLHEKVAVIWLMNGLTLSGAGAKTNAGYGNLIKDE